MSSFHQFIQCTLHCKMGGPKDIELSNFFSTTLRNSIENLLVFGKQQVELLTLLVIELFGVIQPRQGETIRKDDRPRNDRAGERASPCLIDPRHGTNAPDMKLLFIKKRRAPGFPKAPSRVPATLARHRDDGKILRRSPAPSPSR